MPRKRRFRSSMPPMSFPEKRKRKKTEPSPTLPVPSTPDLQISSQKKKMLTTATTKEEKKNPSPTPTQESSPFLSLPDDLLLRCVARVPRLYHPTLALVSKTFRSLLASPELYKARSLLGYTESCLYVSILHEGPGSPWYTLYRKPDKTLTNGTTKSTGYVLERVPSPSYPCTQFPNLVAVGSSIYQISQRGVSVFDCRSHTWRENRWFPGKQSKRSASVLDQKIFVAEHYLDFRSLSNSFQVFDTETQTWDPLPIPPTGRYIIVYGTACIDGKFYVMTKPGVNVAYDPKEGRWELLRSSEISECVPDNSYCVIGNVLYAFSEGKFRWYDIGQHKWRDLYGLWNLPKLRRDDGVRLADYGGKMMAFWKHKFPYGLEDYMTRIWCAEITLERCPGGEIWGEVEWSDHVLTFITPSEVHLVKALGVTL